MIAIYHVLFFSPLLSDIVLVNGIGYFFCTILTLHLLFNVGIIFISTAKQYIEIFKNQLHIRNELKRIQELKGTKFVSEKEKWKKMFLKRKINFMMNQKEQI